MDTTHPDVRAQAGFTLIELMVTIAIMAVLVGIAAPGLRDTLMNVRMSAQVNDLASDLSVARSEAIKLAVPVRLCPTNSGGTQCSGSDWSAGWIVFIDTNNSALVSANERVIRYRPRTSTNISIAAEPSPITTVQFRPTGVSNSAAAAVNTEFKICDGRTGVPNAGRLITVTPTGRAVITRIEGC